MEVVFSPTSWLHLELHHQDVRGRADLLQQLGLPGWERTCRQELRHRLPAEGERLLPRGSKSSILMSQKILGFPRCASSSSLLSQVFTRRARVSRTAWTCGISAAVWRCHGAYHHYDWSHYESQLVIANCPLYYHHDNLQVTCEIVAVIMMIIIIMLIMITSRWLAKQLL